MFKIYDGREHFWQWDLNQKLIVSDPTVNEVHFCNRTDDCSLVVEVYEYEGLRVANVPNILLQDDWKIKVYAYCVDHTKVEASFKVAPRSKPADYVYTETEIKSYDDLVSRIEEVAANATGIQEAPTANIWELDAGIYTISYGFQWGLPDPPVNPRYTAITSGLLVVSIDPTRNNGRIYTVIADNRIYYGRSTALRVMTGNGTEVIVDGSVDWIEKVDVIDNTTTAKFGVPTSEAVKDYVDSLGHIETITLAKSEKRYMEDLEAGIYFVEAPENAVIVAANHYIAVKGNGILILGGAYTEATADAAGLTTFEKSYTMLYTYSSTQKGTNTIGIIKGTKGDDGAWTYEQISGGSIETRGNIAISIDDTTTADHVKYPSAKAVKEYVDSQAGVKHITLARLEAIRIHQMESGFYILEAPERAAIFLGDSLSILDGKGYLIVAGDKTEATADEAGLTEYKKTYIIAYETDARGFNTQLNFGIVKATKGDDGAWTAKRTHGGDIESSWNKTSVIDDASTANHVEYPSAKAVKEYVDAAVANAGGGGDSAITVIEGDANAWDLTSGMYMINGNFYYQSDLTDLGDPDTPAAGIEINNGLVVIKEMIMESDGEEYIFKQFVVINGENVYKGMSQVLDLTEDGLGIFGTGTITATLNVVESFYDVEDEEAENSAIASVAAVKYYLNKEGYVKAGSSTLSQYTTEAEVLALIEANMPASAEEVEY